jgi:hypothetical protein
VSQLVWCEASDHVQAEKYLPRSDHVQQRGKVF